jgi:hypothetical protein
MIHSEKGYAFSNNPESTFKANEGDKYDNNFKFNVERKKDKLLYYMIICYTIEVMMHY